MCAKESVIIVSGACVCAVLDGPIQQASNACCIRFLVVRAALASVSSRRSFILFQDRMSKLLTHGLAYLISYTEK